MKDIDRRDILAWLAERLKPYVWKHCWRDYWVEEIEYSLRKTGNYELDPRVTKSRRAELFYNKDEGGKNDE